MARHEREEEKEFLSDLKARSGRDLAEWMAAIASQGFTDKNETIDWLRGQGFPFARASWLERIHANGGRPIYLDSLPDTIVRPAPAPVPPAPRPLAKPSPPPEPELPGEAARLEKLLAAAKGYRPLFQMLKAEIERAIPSVRLLARPTYVAFMAPEEFAGAALSAAEIRLGLDLGERPIDAYLQAAKLKGAGAGLSHMVVLKDARQVNSELLGLLQTACERVNGRSPA